MPSKNLRPSRFVWIRLSDFETICFKLAREHLSFDEPIPDFITRSPGILESCLKAPLQQFGGRDLYPDFKTKLAILFYLLIKNHPFQNGNKRIALTSLLTVLFLNHFWLRVSPNALYVLAKKVASSSSGDKDHVVVKINRFIRKYLIEA